MSFAGLVRWNKHLHWPLESFKRFPPPKLRHLLTKAKGCNTPKPKQPQRRCFLATSKHKKKTLSGNIAPHTALKNHVRIAEEPLRNCSRDIRNHIKPQKYWRTSEEPLRKPLKVLYGASCNPKNPRWTSEGLWLFRATGAGSEPSPRRQPLNRAPVALPSQLDFDLLPCKRIFSPSSLLHLYALLSSLDYWSKTSLLDARLHPRPIKTEFISLEWTINNISNVYVNLCVGEKLRLFDECLPRRRTHWERDRIKRGTVNKKTKQYINSQSVLQLRLSLFTFYIRTFNALRRVRN